MNVGQLIAELSKLSPDWDVKYLWDGYPRSTVKHVWLARAGYVILADEQDTIYSEKDLPANAILRAAMEHHKYGRNESWDTPTLTKQK